MECGGVRNILTKSLGSNNPHNLLAATMDALHNLQEPEAYRARRGTEN
jgi:small subunit ribosomal protein S5